MWHLKGRKGDCTARNIFLSFERISQGFEWDANIYRLLFQKPYTVNPGGHPRICAVDCGIKSNQIRCLARRGARIDVVPWNHKLEQSHYDGLFLSNGPGDPAKIVETVENLEAILRGPDDVKPIFGICLGHQLLAEAAGCKTRKLRYASPISPILPRIGGKVDDPRP